ncbi:16S rRNA m(7)G-527 methyltransferase [Limimonas halophila]|uniref:Ribosomal RNA small subunit methyltransferase G n=1 Tax=Limimonas halophila TaxID=1082479 RepID=A0A1G7SMZ9_9PROT|nr:16S rRNA (guanine(527)-N(7))-methyltransferase RsmG [Limimonas halophila]SDG24358.1 16S rRNA m(7)G-527 methyltransferase [Limimonas halophila]
MAAHNHSRDGGIATAPAGVSRETGAFDAAAFQRATGVSHETLAALQTHLDLLTKWNRAINLVGKRTLADAWRRHVLDSAQLADLLPPAPEDRPRRIADLGSGAGFPGLVLAILGCGEVHLVESDQRKATFLREVIRRTGANAVVHARRIADAEVPPVDVVTARALAPLSELLTHAAPLLASGGVCLFPKGREAERELTEAASTWKIAAQHAASRSDPEASILRIQVGQP